MKAMRGRWSGVKGAALAQSVLDQLMHGGDLSGLPIDAHDGRWDLRGISFPKPGKDHTRVTGLEIRNQHWMSMDFAGASMRQIRFFDSELDNCVFDSADCRNWSLWGSRIRDCSLDTTNLRETIWSSRYPRTNQMLASTLRGADLRGVVAQEVQTEDCDFSQARLDGAMFERCAIARCRFAGALSEVVFDGRDLGAAPDGRSRPAPAELDDVDFHGADFRFVEFRGFNLERTRLPDRAGIHLIPKYRSVAHRALAELAADSSKEARILSLRLEYSLRGPFRDRDAYVFNRLDFESVADGGSPSLGVLAENVLLANIAEGRHGDTC
ncbi:hypothetical protein Rhe02_73090 [Rhizocola hellebori]|uniref:Pentapeptide repeat-containing protein n=1 Tax=Rhizocola hellebori TaxID=1392758 RepID=A0A8J3QFT3_9ACTN|nr:pentapeptide repeat-containing protein [Rhizocola hellebori]GIH09242.1 hypothetical protein Rhe02_73090 [Rhizocola hellebori]